ncbi:SDR family NAD(P)-dependent oxidoreductase [Novosphingobium sp. BL-52-GroH]|uniref:SDR family NAD(P)-dependent oxidoreductase n=1 Tax=Novosphingobium sp. BL-52-GroH TaxID=3349877 RepID=UPI00384DEF6E
MDGIGYTTARTLAQAGARVAIADISADGLAQVAAKLAIDGLETLQIPLDISDEAAVIAAMQQVKAQFGGLDILDNNAASQGQQGDRLIGDMSTELWDRIFAVNARGTMLMCKHALPLMIEGGGGAIVNISSGTAHAGDLFATAYAASKGAVNTLTRYIATQYGAQGIRCNAIAPGLVMTGKLRENIPPPMLDIFLAHSLNQRVSEATDIANAVLFLASDAARMITGHILPVDGGFYAHIPTVPQTVALFSGQ